MSEQIENVAQHFTANAAIWRDLYVKPRSANDIVLRDRMEIALRLVRAQVAGGGRILDAGCGAGLLSLHLAESGFCLTGVDVSPAMIAQCRELFERRFGTAHAHRFLVGDLTVLDLEKGGYDAVVALGFLEYQPDEGAALAAIAALLKPGGLLIVTGPQKSSIARLLYGLTGRFSGKKQLRPEVAIHLYGVRRCRRLLGAAGLRMTGKRRHGFASFPLIGGGRKGILLHRALSAAARVLPLRSLCNDIVVTARKP